MKRELLMLAKTYDGTQDVRGWYCSDKYDGERCFWDGGITRGIAKAMVPWANTLKDSRYKEAQIATGLWTRYGHVIHAPDWWIDSLPRGVFLDGELWMGNGSFQTLRSTVGRQDKTGDWSSVRYLLIDSPPIDGVFVDGRINTPNWKDPGIDWRACKMFTLRHGCTNTNIQSFRDVYPGLTNYASDVVEPIEQTIVPYTEPERWLADRLRSVTDEGGEGLILRRPDSYWEPYRGNWLLKVKPALDAEGTVVGWVAGEGKYTGMLGSLIVESHGLTFNLSGFTDDERKITDNECQFPNGTIVSFKYMGLTDRGVPREPRYWRKK